MQTFADCPLWLPSLLLAEKAGHESRTEPVSIYDRPSRVCVLLESLGSAVTVDQAESSSGLEEGWGLLGERPCGLQAPRRAADLG